MITQTLIEITGKQLPDKLKYELQRLGVVKVISKELVKVVPSCPPVGSGDKYAEHKKGLFEIDKLVKWIEKGITLIRDSISKTLIRVNGDVVRIYQKGVYASMGRDYFLKTMKLMPHKYVPPSIRAVLSEDEDYDLTFLDMPMEISTSLANVLMGWNGNKPSNKSQQLTIKPPYYVHSSGKFTPELFKSLVKRRFTRFADKDQYHLLTINGNKVTIFVGGSRGLMDSWNRKDFMVIFSRANGNTFSQKLDSIIQAGDPSEHARSEALDAMPWKANPSEGIYHFRVPRKKARK